MAGANRLVRQCLDTALDAGLVEAVRSTELLLGIADRVTLRMLRVDNRGIAEVTAEPAAVPPDAGVSLLGHSRIGLPFKRPSLAVGHDT